MLKFLISSNGGPACPNLSLSAKFPEPGILKPQELQAISQKSCSVLRNCRLQIQWLHSYVTADKIYCVYIAPDEATVREHARQGGFPANSISEIRTVIDPTTAE